MDSLVVVDAVDAVVGGGEVRRTLPTRAKRTIGAWCFLDHYGPDTIDGGPGMAVGPHPHIGLQTVSWLVEGEIVHSDSLGFEQAIRPGQLNLMTAGRGIAHAEVSPTPHPATLHGTQLWLALPEDHRDRAPTFDHLPDIPVTGQGLGGWEATVLVGSFAGVTSPAAVYSPLVGVELSFGGSGGGWRGGPRSASADVPLDPGFEHGLVVLSGRLDLPELADPSTIGPDRLVVLPAGRTSITLTTDRPARALLLGGTPWQGPLVMWWNFVGGSGAEIEEARDDWQAGRRFGTTAFAEVPGATVPRIAAPPLPPGQLVSRT